MCPPPPPPPPPTPVRVARNISIQVEEDLYEFDRVTEGYLTKSLNFLQTEYVGTLRSDNESMILPDLLSMRHILSSHISVPDHGGVNDVTCVPTLGGLSLGGIYLRQEP